MSIVDEVQTGPTAVGSAIHSPLSGVKPDYTAGSRLKPDVDQTSVRQIYGIDFVRLSEAITPLVTDLSVPAEDQETYAQEPTCSCSEDFLEGNLAVSTRSSQISRHQE